MFITVDVISGVYISLPCISCVNRETTHTQKKLKTERELLRACDKLTCFENSQVDFAHETCARAFKQTFFGLTTNDLRFIAAQNRLHALCTLVLQLSTKAMV